MKLLAEIEIMGLPQTINQIGRKHWSFKAKEAKKWKGLVFAQCVYKRISGNSLGKVSIEFTRYSSREPDFDNLAGSFKHVLDGLVFAKVIMDDKPSIIGSPIFKWEKAKRKDARIGIKIFID